MNRLPIARNKFVLSSDVQIIREAKKEELQKRYQAKLFQEGQALADNDDSLDQPLFTELDEDLDDQEFNEKLSYTTCKIADIEGFMFGGISSRFWCLRKHVNSLNQEELKNVPFFNWNCITINCKDRDVDLVIN